MTDRFARRAGRLAFGVVMILGAANLAIITSAGWRLHGAVAARLGPWLHAAECIGLTWLAAAVAGAVVRVIAARLPDARIAGARFASSWVIPSVGVALLLPLTLHLLVSLCIESRREFDEWTAISCVVTCLPHAVFAVLCALRAWSLAAGKRAPSPMLIYAVTVLASCVPIGQLSGVVSGDLFLVPPMTVAVTGLPILPLLYAMERRITRERAEIETISQALPRAVARLARGRA